MTENKPVSSGDQCPYCGAEIDPGYYFCTNCATPHSPVESVLPEEKEPYKSIQNRVRDEAPQVYHLFWAFCIVLLISTLISLFLLDGRQHPVRSIYFQSAVLFATTLGFAFVYRSSLIAQLNVTGMLHPWMALGILLLIPLLGMNFGYQKFLLEYLEMDQTMVDRLREQGMTYQSMILVLCVAPALVEEVAFRGLIQHWLKTVLDPVTAILIASGVFAFVHFSFLEFPVIFLAGLLFGWTKWKTRSLFPPMILHFLHNFVVIHYFSF